MGLSVILPLTNGATLRARFFHLHGVTLESQSRSRSGVRDYDGMVVFAMPADRVSVDAWGCSCRLWAGSNRLLDTLRNCRLAMEHGVAEGFLIDRDQAPIEPPELLSLRVVKVGTEYWARWGSAARAERSRTRAPHRGARSQ